MKKFPQIVLAQLNPTVGDLRGNFDKITKVLKNHRNIADLVVFSEMITTGYPTDDLVLNPYFIDRIEHYVHELSKEIKDTTVILPTPWRIDGKLYNTVLVIADGEIKQIITKYHLPNYGVFDEKRIFTRAQEMPVPYDLNGIKLGIMICEDMWFDDVAQNLKDHGADILIVPNGSPFQTDIAARRKDQALNRVKETGLPLIYLNQVGGQDELVFDGHSFAMDAKGNITDSFPGFEEHIAILDGGPSAASSNEIETIYKAVTLGLRDYVQKNGFPGVVIGMSGGIDSALSAAIAADAIGADKVHCVMMPSPYTSQESLDDAAECSKLLGIKHDIIPIEPAMNAFHGILEQNIDNNNAGTTFENLQSRARGIILMALSNAEGKMVLSTGNKSEMAVGYATLYGDMCGGFNALKDLYKTQVYELSRWRNKQGIVIPENIINKAPTAELKPNQTDQDTLPPYDILDDILRHLIEHDTAPEKIPHDKETVMKVWRMLDIAEYKRRQAPPGVKITSKAFGRDRRYPITNGFFKSHQK